MGEESVKEKIKNRLSPLGMCVIDFRRCSKEGEALSFDASFRFDMDQFLFYANLKGSPLEDSIRLYKIHNRVETKSEKAKYESIIINYDEEYPGQMIVYLVNNQMKLDMTFDRADYEKILESMGYQKELSEIRLTKLFDATQSQKKYREATVDMINDVADYSYKIEAELFQHLQPLLLEERPWGDINDC